MRDLILLKIKGSNMGIPMRKADLARSAPTVSTGYSQMNWFASAAVHATEQDLETNTCIDTRKMIRYICKFCGQEIVMNKAHLFDRYHNFWEQYLLKPMDNYWYEID